jgi:DNA-binding transcriptional ArsR family regulator
VGENDKPAVESIKFGNGNSEKCAILTDLAKKISALDNPVKLNILSLLVESGSLSITDVAKKLDLNFSTAHKYLEQLEAAGLVTSKEISDVRLKRQFTVKNFDITLSPEAISKGYFKKAAEGKDFIILDARSKPVAFKQKNFIERFVDAGVPLNLIQEGLEDIKSKIYNEVSLIELENAFIEYLKSRGKKIDEALKVCETEGIFSEDAFAHLIKKRNETQLINEAIEGEIHIENLGKAKLMNFSHDLHVLEILGLNSPPKNIDDFLNQLIDVIKDCQEIVLGKHVFDTFNYFLAPFVSKLSDAELTKILENFFKKMDSMGIKLYVGVDVGTPRFFSYVKTVSPTLLPEEKEKLDTIQPPGITAVTIPYTDFSKDAQRITKALVTIFKKNKFKQVFLVIKFWSGWAKSNFSDEDLDEGFLIANMIPAWQDANAIYMNSLRIDSKWKHWYRSVRVGEVQNIVINLPRLALKSKTKEEFLKLLAEKLVASNKLLLLSAEAILGRINNLAPPITRKRPKRGQYVHLDDSIFSISICGLDEAIQILSGKKLADNPKLGAEILDYCTAFAKEKSEMLLRTVIKENRNDAIARRFYHLDSKKFKLPVKSYATGMTADATDETLDLQQKLPGGHCAFMPKSKIKLKTLLKKNWGLIKIT